VGGWEPNKNFQDGNGFKGTQKTEIASLSVGEKCLPRGKTKKVRRSLNLSYGSFYKGEERGSLFCVGEEQDSICGFRLERGDGVFKNLETALHRTTDSQKIRREGETGEKYGF